MLKWLQFNMGLTDNKRLKLLLPVLQRPLPNVSADNGDQLGLGWFINPERTGWSASISKDGELDGFNCYIAFLPSAQPGKDFSQAGAFVLINGDGIRKDRDEIAAVLTNSLLLIMQDKPLPADEAVHPRS